MVALTTVGRWVPQVYLEKEGSASGPHLFFHSKDMYLVPTLHQALGQATEGSTNKAATEIT